MNIVEAISYIQFNNGGKRIPLKKAGEVCGVTEQTIGEYKKKDIPDEWKIKLEEKYGYKLPCEIHSSVDMAHKYVDIPYWDECETLSEKLKNPACTQVCKDLEVVINGLKAVPENLRIIAMPSDKMEGGERPIKYGDILIIDTSLTDISYSGIYFFIANNEVFVNRVDKSIDSVSFKFDNEKYAKKTYDFEQLKNANFKVIGRVLHNEWDAL